MNHLFLFICFMLMWLMIFGVYLYYLSFVDISQISQVLFVGLTTFFSGSLVWLALGYSLSFYGNLSRHLFVLEQFSVDQETMLVQLMFALYAVTMLIGSTLGRINWGYITFLVPFWLIFVYAPICFSLWGSNPWLSQLGVLDFSGGLVVHTSAGIGSLVLALKLPHRQRFHRRTHTQTAFTYLGTTMITFGWFGFNIAPSLGLNQLGISVWLNTLLAILGGGVGWTLVSVWLERKWSVIAICNGMVTGLVASTTTVGHVFPGAAFLIAFLVGAMCVSLIHWLSRTFTAFEDVVDSFGMNGIGGMLGSILGVFFAKEGQFHVQLLGTVIVGVWSLVGCLLLQKIGQVLFKKFRHSGVELKGKIIEVE